MDTQRRNPIRLAALLVGALALFATACAGGDDSGLFDDTTDAADAADIGAHSDGELGAGAQGGSTSDAGIGGLDTDDQGIGNHDDTEHDDTDQAEAAIDDQVEAEEEAASDDEAQFADLDGGENPLQASDAPTARGDDAHAGAASEPTDGASAPVDSTSSADQTESAATAEESDAEGLFARPAIEPVEPDTDPEPERTRLEDNRFADYGYRRFVDAHEDPLSTFALDVDTGSWTVARRWLAEGVLPPPEAVRVEEFVNWFDYDYDTPRRGLEVSIDGGPSPFDDDNLLVRVGVAAEEVGADERPPVSLTFIVDTSGSMDRDDRLGLVKESLAILVDQLDRDDTVALVVYSDGSGVVLEPTPVRERHEILDAIDSLRPGGSTNLESGLREGYRLAASTYRDDGINRVVIASDGVANSGITDQVELSRIIRSYAEEGIQLVTVGYGMGNFNDTMMEQLADNGDGFYAYVDDRDEAERLFDTELTSTLVTAAIDAKIQVEFDPNVVDDYRLIGFENRGVHDRDFRNDRVDAGELGAGHQVTAIYEIELQPGVSVDDRGDLGQVYLRWEDPTTHEVIEIDEDIDLRHIEGDWYHTDDDFRLATVVTAFAEVLRDNPYADDVRLTNIAVEAERLSDRLPRDDQDKVDVLVEMLHAADRLDPTR